ncbi:MAG: hypothetical protein NWF05_06540 [Candidatus Bathyarchaeota archaeon]|nr:hypothetical protein [Candidatus Bathyarchaeota archaeon]
MKKLLWVSLALIVLVVLAGLGVFRGAWLPASEDGFQLVSVEDNSLFVSDPDIVSYNSTSQEITLTAQASQRLTQMGDELYRSVVAIRINGEEMCQGLFRTAYMSSIPPPSKISIFFPSDLTDDHALRLLYAQSEPSSNLQENYVKFIQYFDDANKLTQ